MTFVAFHADFKKRDLLSISPAQMLNLLFRSAELHHPGCVKVVLTDRATSFDGLDAGVDVRRHDVDPAKTMWSRMRAEIEYLERADFSSDIALVDTDMLIQARLSPLSSESFDVALTYRAEDELPYNRKELAINGGFIFLRKGRKEQALRFLRSVHAIYSKDYADKEAWWGDQHALMDAVGKDKLPAHGERVVEAGGTSVLLLPVDVYNFSPEPRFRAILSPARGKKIMHFKGKRKRLMQPYWDAHLAPQRKLGAKIRILTGAVLESREPAEKKKPAPRVSARLAWRRVWQSRFVSGLRLDARLRRLIAGRRVLIIGSGPSAAELKELPPDTLIFTCNAGLKLFSDRGFIRPPDLFFFVRSKRTKTVSAGANEEPVKKMDLIEELLGRVKTKILVTNIREIEDNPKLHGSYSELFFDDGCHNAYLEKLIAPQTCESVRGNSEVTWTSTGIRLLQYALAFGAKEVFLIGMDLGADGYFWGPHLREWRHSDIDENVVRVIAKKFQNVYSASAQSPLARCLPHKSLDASETAVRNR